MFNISNILENRSTEDKVNDKKTVVLQYYKFPYNQNKSSEIEINTETLSLLHERSKEGPILLICK